MFSAEYESAEMLFFSKEKHQQYPLVLFYRHDNKTAYSNKQNMLTVLNKPNA